MKNRIEPGLACKSIRNSDRARIQHRRRPAFPALLGAAQLFCALFGASLAAIPVQAADPTDTFYGTGALANVTTGTGDSAFGYNALNQDTIGNANTAIGSLALFSNTTGSVNTANGFQALFSNTTGSENTANGFEVLLSNTTGSGNTANGFEALVSNSTGSSNTANGVQALFSNTAGINNTATGFNALFNNTTGTQNTANGVSALQNNTTGNNNIALGFVAGNLLTTGSNNIDIGNLGATAGEVGKIRIGTKGTQKATFIAGISGVTVASGVGVIINTQGQLGTVVSSARFKDKIQPMDKASEAILSLQPVTFRYKKEFDPQGIPQFGLVAEQVEKVNPDSGGTRRSREALYRSLRSGERDVAK